MMECHTNHSYFESSLSEHKNIILLWLTHMPPIEWPDEHMLIKEELEPVEEIQARCGVASSLS